MRNFYLVGLPGSGKTTVGRILARRLGWRFVDLDRLIVSREGKTVAELFAEGEAEFRQKETEALKSILGEENCVVSTGGGIVETPENREILKGETVLYVVRHPRSILQTLNTEKRPIFRNDPEKIYALARVRCPLYEQVADLRVTNNRSLYSCVGRAEALLAEWGVTGDNAGKNGEKNRRTTVPTERSDLKKF